MTKSSMITAAGRTGALRSGVSLAALCLAAVPHAAFAQDAAATPAQGALTPNAAQRTAPSDRAAAAVQTDAATGVAQPSANAQVPSGGAEVTQA